MTPGDERGDAAGPKRRGLGSVENKVLEYRDDAARFRKRAAKTYGARRAVLTRIATDYENLARQREDELRVIAESRRQIESSWEALRRANRCLELV